LLERDSFDLLLLEFDKPWVIHLRETCCCSTNLCTWRPNTVYKNKSLHRHHDASKNKVKQNNNKLKDWKRETPLAEIFFFPGNGARKLAWRFAGA
jgi:hypothetical protein